MTEPIRGFPDLFTFWTNFMMDFRMFPLIAIPGETLFAAAVSTSKRSFVNFFPFIGIKQYCNYIVGIVGWV
ncbi:uncharacterized protein K452DRAFT_293185 [Aplosporella prunicola CBS 121167]|uniref:Uncharacterized protein n=1 Tax=Aplosporella prunicola CBS 121167 TaxID=1176127 RepID=A0A6A6AU44_9PEZI|nr:uncharacterized protein K452DRAFT_293185 [Aplosporella prunicola CBS 121167]KAF2135469.1 hypothetical protein K452DRAFT_293185 [Aplosporella prunicola CBS 121167]